MDFCTEMIAIGARPREQHRLSLTLVSKECASCRLLLAALLLPIAVAVATAARRTGATTGDVPISESKSVIRVKPAISSDLPESELPADFSVLYTTALIGNLTHCACGGVNLGGIGRIATVIQRQGNGEGEKRGNPSATLPSTKLGAGRAGGETAGQRLLVLDAGGLLEPNFPSPHVQARAVGRFLAEAAYDGVSSHQPALLFPGAVTRTGTEPTVVCANVVDLEASASVASPYALEYVGGARVALVGLASSEEPRAKVAPPSAFEPASEFYARQAEQFKAMLKAEQQHGSDSEASRAVIQQLVSDVERFERLAKEWREKARDQEAGGRRQKQVKVTDPLETLRSLMPMLRSKCDLVIVLSQCGLSTDRTIARTHPHVIVIGGVGATVLKQPEQIGESWVLPTSVQGADVCAVDIEVIGDRLALSEVEGSSVIGKGKVEQQQSVRVAVRNFQKHPVNASVPEDPEVLKILEDYFAELAHVAQRAVRQMPPGRRFVGSQKCTACHEKEGKSWKESKHAHAMDTLKDALDLLSGTGRNPQSAIRPGVSGVERNPQSISGHGQKFPPNRINECYLCHRLTPPEGLESSHGVVAVSSLDTRFSLSAVEGHSSALPAPSAVEGSGVEGSLPPRLRSGQAEGVGCESCHGAGELHAQDARRPIPVARPAESTCLSCHTPTRSPKFVFAKYWKAVRH